MDNNNEAVARTDAHLAMDARNTSVAELARNNSAAATSAVAWMIDNKVNYAAFSFYFLSLYLSLRVPFLDLL